MSRGGYTPRHFRQALQACENNAAAFSGSACRIGVISPRRSMSIARSVRARHRRVAGSVVFSAVIDALNASARTAASLSVFRVITPHALTQHGEQITQNGAWRVGIDINHVTESTRAALAAQRQPDVILSGYAKLFPISGNATRLTGDHQPARASSPTGPLVLSSRRAAPFFGWSR